MKVKVVEPYRVVHEGKPYVGGDVLEIPDDDEHKIWLQSGWVQLVDLAARRLATMLADRTAHRGQQPQFGVDRVQVAHIRSAWPPVRCRATHPQRRCPIVGCWLARPQYDDKPRVQLDGLVRRRRLGARAHSCGDHWRHDVKAVLTMAHDVFISHSHADKPAADAACAALEAKGIRCWIAPRDINPGQDWAASIVEAIRGARDHAARLQPPRQPVAPSPTGSRTQPRIPGKCSFRSGSRTCCPKRRSSTTSVHRTGWMRSLHRLRRTWRSWPMLARACWRSLVDRPEPATCPDVAAPRPAIASRPDCRDTDRNPSADRRPAVVTWWRRQRRQVRVGLIAATVVILAAGGYFRCYDHTHPHPQLQSRGPPPRAAHHHLSGPSRRGGRAGGSAAQARPNQHRDGRHRDDGQRRAHRDG